ncbi:MAG: Asp-tRNA(Asn)/Glu-tRNA(Gln) amidotransferase GatCAB subunit B, partial [Candidatus Dormibacteraeota bacterium]|nr:Asp-tRNA(Asn)/Glu-tRNA(Gln) amidotransferase GatCAB subunit B [Candidatus Dormibacteraeota bacterium]
EVLSEAFGSGASPVKLIRDRGLGQLSDSAEIATLVDQVLAEHAQAAADYQAGKDQALGALVGEVMARSGRKANPKVVNQLLRERLPR